MRPGGLEHPGIRKTQSRDPQLAGMEDVPHGPRRSPHGEEPSFWPRWYVSYPDWAIVGARVLRESGDEPDRYHTTRSRKNADTSPITYYPGLRKAALARHLRSRGAT